MYLCVPHLRNLSTSDTVILFCPAEHNPRLSEGHRENPTPLLLCLFFKSRRDWWLKQAACLRPQSRSHIPALHRSTQQWNPKESVSAWGQPKQTTESGLWHFWYHSHFSNQLWVCVCLCVFSECTLKPKWPLNERDYTSLYICEPACICVYMRMSECV